VNTIWMIAGLLLLFALWMADLDPRWLWAYGLTLLALCVNTVIATRNQLEKAYASICVMLQKRHDLIPNLVATVERYLEHESDVLDRVTALRARATASSVSPGEQVKVEGEIGKVLHQIVVTAEGYPELKASEGFQQLQRSLNETEEQLAAARRAYNAAVKQYQDHRRMFPASLLALALRYGERPYFEVSDPRVTERPEVPSRLRATDRS
jgi:LemA protein